MVISIILSLTSFDMVKAPEFVGFANYVKLIVYDPIFLTAIKKRYLHLQIFPDSELLLCREITLPPGIIPHSRIRIFSGTAARYSAADPEVLRQLPWSNAELSALLDQFEATVGIEAVPGNCMTTRMVQYAFNDVVAKNAKKAQSLSICIYASSI